MSAPSRVLVARLTTLSPWLQDYVAAHYVERASVARLHGEVETRTRQELNAKLEQVAPPLSTHSSWSRDSLSIYLVLMYSTLAHDTQNSTTTQNSLTRSTVSQFEQTPLNTHSECTQSTLTHNSLNSSSTTRIQQEHLISN